MLPLRLLPSSWITATYSCTPPNSGMYPIQSLYWNRPTGKLCTENRSK